MGSIEQLTEEILSLPSVSRALLADKLVESLEFDTDSTIQAVWVTEAKRRRGEVRDGSVQPISGEEALAQVRRLIEPWGMYFTLKLSLNMLKRFNTIQGNGLRLHRHLSMLSRIRFIELEHLLLIMLLLMMLSDDAWHADFPMQFSIQSSKTTFSFWRLCIAAENLDTGKVVDSRSSQQPNGNWFNNPGLSVGW